MLVPKGGREDFLPLLVLTAYSKCQRHPRDANDVATGIE